MGNHGVLSHAATNNTGSRRGTRCGEKKRRTVGKKVEGSSVLLRGIDLRQIDTARATE